MAIEILNDKIRYAMQGLSTDSKPTNVEPGSTFYEIDTHLLKVFSATNAGSGNGWW